MNIDNEQLLPETEFGRSVIRDARPSDGSAMQVLLSDLDYLLPRNILSGRIEELQRDQRSRLWIVEVDSTPVCLLSLYLILNLGLVGDIARIFYLAISAQFRGRGLGTALLNKTDNLAKELGCDRIEVNSHQRRVRVHQFYFRENYKESPKYLVKYLKD